MSSFSPVRGYVVLALTLTSFKFISLITYKYESHLFPCYFNFLFFLHGIPSDPLTFLKSNSIDYK